MKYGPGFWYALAGLPIGLVLGHALMRYWSPWEVMAIGGVVWLASLSQLRMAQDLYEIRARLNDLRQILERRVNERKMG